jgi:hypothetical protein
MDKEKVTWRTFADPKGVIEGRWKPGTGTFYLLDHKGVIRHKWLTTPGEKVIDRAVEKLVEEAEKDAKKSRK